MSRGDYVTVEVERTTHQDIIPSATVRYARPVFQQPRPQNRPGRRHDLLQSGNRLKITLLTDELPDWSRDGKLGIEMLFDDKSYDEMQDALKLANALAEGGKNRLVNILTGDRPPPFIPICHPLFPGSTTARYRAVNTILAANELAIVHGPPGTGKTTTLVQAIKALNKQDHKQILVVAPSNTAVDLLSEKLHEEGLNVLRVGNPSPRIGTTDGPHAGP